MLLVECPKASEDEVMARLRRGIELKFGSVDELYSADPHDGTAFIVRWVSRLADIMRALERWKKKTDGRGEQISS